MSWRAWFHKWCVRTHVSALVATRTELQRGELRRTAPTTDLRLGISKPEEGSENLSIYWAMIKSILDLFKEIYDLRKPERAWQSTSYLDERRFFQVGTELGKPFSSVGDFVTPKLLW